MSRTVSGCNAPGGATQVTVNLLRNTLNPSDRTVTRNVVDTFTTPVVGAVPAIFCTTGGWTGLFSTHAFATFADQVEVTYGGVPGVETFGADTGLTVPGANT